MIRSDNSKQYNNKASVKTFNCSSRMGGAKL